MQFAYKLVSLLQCFQHHIQPVILQSQPIFTKKPIFIANLKLVYQRSQFDIETISKLFHRQCAFPLITCFIVFRLTSHNPF